jgi:hypothetical protein
MLAVVGQQAITIFPQTGSRSADNLADIEIGGRTGYHPDALAACEMSERNFFHRSSTQPARESRVVNDLASTDVDSVMQIAASRCDKVRTQRRFLVPDQEPIGSVLPIR